MAGIITKAGTALIASKQASSQALVIKNFVFAYIENLDTNATPPETETIPSADKISYNAELTRAAFVNPAQVVYSIIVGSDVGDWKYNWLGLQAEDGTLFAVVYVPTQQKVRNIPPSQIGNTITRNFLITYDGAQQTTQITIPAESWQFDISAQLDDMDERSRLLATSIYGQSTFLSDGLKLVTNAGQYSLTSGKAVIGGLIVNNQSSLNLSLPGDTNIYLDVFLQKNNNTKEVIFNPAYGDKLTDYTDDNGVRHSVSLVATIKEGNITDQRLVIPATSLVAAISDDPQGDPKKIASIGALQKLKDDLITNNTTITGNSDLTKDMRGFVTLNATSNDTFIKLPPSTLENKGLEYILMRADNSENFLRILANGNDKIFFHLHLNASGYPHFELFGAGDYWHIYATGQGSWLVMSRYDGSPMGTALPLTSLMMPSGGYFTLAQTEFEMTRFPWLVDYANKSGMVASAFNSEKPGLWVVDSANNKLRSPEVRGEFLRALDLGRGADTNRGAGVYQADAIRNITGSLGGVYKLEGTTTEGVFYTSNWGPRGIVWNANNNNLGVTQTLSFNASLKVPTATENRPRNVAFPYIFKAI